MMRNMLNFFMVGLLVVLVVASPVASYADDSDCTYFSPAFVLCSVHSHNIGSVGNESIKDPKNPTAAEQIADMNEVIALKATVIAQQLKKQYDALDSVIKRFKTQLEKSVWQSKIEIVTGSASSDSGGASGNNKGIAGAEECEFASANQLHDCLRRNLNKVKQSVDKDLSSAKEQLKLDTAVMNGFQMCKDKDCIAECGNLSKADIKRCITKLISFVGSDERNQQNNQSRYRGGNI